jgi:hypothetical protein
MCVSSSASLKCSPKHPPSSVPILISFTVIFRPLLLRLPLPLVLLRSSLTNTGLLSILRLGKCLQSLRLKDCSALTQRSLDTLQTEYAHIAVSLSYYNRGLLSAITQRFSARKRSTDEDDLSSAESEELGSSSGH